MLNIIDINNNANSVRVNDHRTQYNKNDLLYAAERVKNARRANINKRGGRIALAHNIKCSGRIKHKTPRQLKHKLFINRDIDEYGDGYAYNILDNEYYNNIIVIDNRFFTGINAGDYEQLYCSIETGADNMAGEITDIIHGVNDYYNTVSEAVADYLNIENISADQAAAVQRAASDYMNNKKHFDEYAAALLTALTPHKWSCCTLRGSCQRDWINILYPADVYNDDDIKEYECYFFGLCDEFTATYKNDNVVYYYSYNYDVDDIIKSIAADFNAGPDQIVFHSCY